MALAFLFPEEKPMSRIRGCFVLCVVAALTGCASGPKPLPEPDMTRLIIVNKTLPVELMAPQGPASPVAEGVKK